MGEASLVRRWSFLGCVYVAIEGVVVKRWHWLSADSIVLWLGFSVNTWGDTLPFPPKGGPSKTSRKSLRRRRESNVTVFLARDVFILSSLRVFANKSTWEDFSGEHIVMEREEQRTDWAHIWWPHQPSSPKLPALNITITSRAPSRHHLCCHPCITSLRLRCKLLHDIANEAEVTHFLCLLGYYPNVYRRRPQFPIAIIKTHQPPQSNLSVVNVSHEVDANQTSLYHHEYSSSHQGFYWRYSSSAFH